MRFPYFPSIEQFESDLHDKKSPDKPWLTGAFLFDGEGWRLIAHQHHIAVYVFFIVGEIFDRSAP